MISLHNVSISLPDWPHVEIQFLGYIGLLDYVWMLCFIYVVCITRNLMINMSLPAVDTLLFFSNNFFSCIQLYFVEFAGLCFNMFVRANFISLRPNGFLAGKCRRQRFFCLICYKFYLMNFSQLSIG